MSLTPVYYHNTSVSTQTLDEGLVVPASAIVPISDYFSYDLIANSSTIASFVASDDARLSTDGVTPLSVAASQELLTSLYVVTSGRVVPSAGDAGSILYKATATDYDIAWSGIRVTNSGDSLSVEGAIELLEDPGNGTNKVSLSAPTSLGSDLSLILPSQDGTDGQSLKTDGSGNLSFGNAEVVPTFVSSTISGNTTGDTTLFTAGASDNYVPRFFVIRLVDDTSIGGNLRFSIGTDAGASNIVASTLALGFNSTTEAWIVTVQGNTALIAGSDDVVFKVITAFTGTGDIVVESYLRKL